MKLEILETANGLVIALPDEVLKKLGVGLGDEIDLTEATAGYSLTTNFSEFMEAAHLVMEEDYETLKRLADGPESLQA
jgi:antitoxin component of MazEF toxin-antitoxin module